MIGRKVCVALFPLLWLEVLILRVLMLGHFETVPYDDRTIRSVYHIREYDVARLLQVCLLFLLPRRLVPSLTLIHDS